MVELCRLVAVSAPKSPRGPLKRLAWRLASRALSAAWCLAIGMPLACRWLRGRRPS